MFLRSSVLHLLCLLLLLFSSFLLMAAVEPAGQVLLVQSGSTQANCSSGCNATDRPLSPVQNQPSVPVLLNNSALLLNNSRAELLTDSKDTRPPSLSTSPSLLNTVGSRATDPVTTLAPPTQPASTSHQSSSSRAEDAAVTTANLTSGSSRSPGPSTTVEPVTHTVITPVIPAVTSPQYTTTSTTTTTTTVLPHPSTTTKPVSMTSDTKTSSSPGAASPLETRKPTDQGTEAATSSVTRNATSTGGSGSAVVEAAGAALTRQLVDTASLMAVLLFGLLFFLVTVAVFITQAYESYRRKDYTQVDYLINGMYIDSGV